MNENTPTDSAGSLPISIQPAPPRFRGDRWAQTCRAGTLAASVVLVLCVLCFLFLSRHWPLVNDAALMHYVVFLMQHGLAPYRDIGDINLPGAWAPEWVSLLLAPRLHLSAAATWRVMDAALVIASAIPMMWVSWRYSRFAGLFAGALFALYHGRDGIGQAGQRDLWIAALLLWAVACLLAAFPVSESTPGGQASRRPQQAPGAAMLPCFFFGLFVGAASAIKPVAAIFLLCLLPLPGAFAGARRRLTVLSAIVAGFAVPLIGTLLFLWRWHAVGAFFEMARRDLPYHASLGTGSFRQLVQASAIPSIGKLGILFVATAALAGGWRASLLFSRRPASISAHPADWYRAPARGLLGLCILLAFAGFLAQGKGFPYQRYPHTAFFLLLAALEFSAAVRSHRWTLRTLGTAGFVFGVVLCAPSYLRSIARADWPVTVTAAIENALTSQASPAAVASLDGAVQCLDVIGGCTDALLHLRLREATGTLYDEFLFPQRPEHAFAPPGQLAPLPQPGDRTPAAVLAGQLQFQRAIIAHPPRVLIVSAWLFPQGPGEYRKLALWPWFDQYLDAHYRLAEQHDFAPAENGPMGFRVYVRRARGLD